MAKDFIRKKLVQGLMENEIKPVKINAGVLIKCTTTGNILLLLRNDPVPSWALVSGGIQPNEDPLEGLKREIYEEMFVNPDIIQYKFVNVEKHPERNSEFYYYQGFTKSEFKPILDEENLNYGWFPIDKLPSPLFRGLSEKIAKL